VAGAANAIFFNHGQCCVAGSRLFVQQSRFDEVIEGVSQIAKSIKLGPGMEPDTQMGPLVSEEQLRRVTGYLDSGREDGATSVTGGTRHGDKGYFVEPTVITNTRPDMRIVREEIFGPVVVAAPFQSLDEIAAAANDSEYGLGAGIWTQDISKAHALAKKLRSGTVWINCYNVFDASLPFGGYKQSGWGREMGHEALEAYTEVKAVTAQL
jgi:phenylacetaldehyde dehydrogenase